MTDMNITALYTDDAVLKRNRLADSIIEQMRAMP